MKAPLVLVVILSAAVSASAQGRFSFEAFLGAAYNFRTSLEIEQDGESALDIDADYSTRPFELPPYYSFRFGIHDVSGAWEIQFDVRRPGGST